MITRRDAIAILGGTAVAPFLRRVSAQGPIIRTLTKDLSPGATNGAILFHEHLSIRYR